MANYYDIDSIMTDAQKIPCTFELSVPGLGYLNGNVGEDVRATCPPNDEELKSNDFRPGQVRHETGTTSLAWRNACSEPSIKQFGFGNARSAICTLPTCDECTQS